MVSEGDLLAGKYRVERILGEGGMGYVVAAIHEQLEQRVAVKLLVPELAEDPDAVERFLREARASVRIQSEHVARVIDVGELADGAPYLVMEFLSGRDLAQELEARETFEIGVAIDYVLQACEALAEAHALGVIHRDLKPANLFLTHRPDGSPLVKVLDFGISKALKSQSGSGGASPSLTAAQSFLGSPAYMSPEQARRPKTVDTRTDIWALGVVLYEFLGGETPFVGDVPLEVLTAAAADPMPSLREMRKDVPAELEAVIRRCLEKKADDRYQTVADFAEALRPFAPVESRRSISRIAGILRTSLAPQDPSSTTLKSSSVPAPADSADTEAAPVSPISPSERRDRDKDTQMHWGKSQSGTRRSRRTLVLAGALAALVVAGLGVYGLGGRRDITPPPGERANAAQPSVPAPATATAPVAVLPPAAPVATAPAPSAATPAPSASVAPPPVAKVAAPVTTGTKTHAPAAAKPRKAAPAAPGDDEDPLANRR
ncbi:MAG TPA: serine/threonine-protein kinase [Polyangiaceae bacterium]|nr:serine/threonine-protein kinase [Polyangiaceae bacterium]